MMILEMNQKIFHIFLHLGQPQGKIGRQTMMKFQEISRMKDHYLVHLEAAEKGTNSFVDTFEKLRHLKINLENENDVICKTYSILEL